MDYLVKKNKMGKADIIVIVICSIILLAMFFKATYFIYSGLDKFFGGPRYASIVNKKVTRYLERKYPDFDFKATKSIKDILHTNDWFCNVDVLKDKEVIFSTTIQYISESQILSDNFEADLENYNKNSKQ